MGHGSEPTAIENIVWCCFMLAILSMLVGGWIRQRKRVKASRYAVTQRGWTWIGKGLPVYLPARELLNEPYTPMQVSNAFAGTQRGLEFLAFDCVLGQGRQRKYRSMVAVLADHNPFEVERFNPELAVTEAAGWFALRREAAGILFRSRKMDAVETVAIIDSLGSALTSDTSPAA